MKYSLILWDFDGTVADTLPQGLEVYNAMAERHGFRPVTDPQSVRELSPNEFLKAHGIPLFRVPRLVREFLAAQSDRMPTTPLCPEIDRVLRRLSDSDCLQAIVSSNNEANIRTCLKANDVDEHFRFVVGYSRLFGKRHAIRRAVESQRIDPRRVLYIGDEVRDIEAAREVGIDMAAVTWGFNSKTVLADRRPTYLVETPAALAALIDDWSS